MKKTKRMNKTLHQRHQLALNVIRDGLAVAKAARSPRAVRRELARKEDKGNG